jgi:Patatin-like phospholipase
MAGKENDESNTWVEDIDKLLDLEKDRLGIKHRESVALCLSGGGIRSASFSLGVIQALAELGILKKLDYLSTVSGGGYIGTWLTAWSRQHENGIEGVEKEIRESLNSKSEPEEIQTIRKTSNFLAPKTGVLSGLGTVGIQYCWKTILHWLTIAPWILALMCAARILLYQSNNENLSTLFDRDLLDSLSLTIALLLIFLNPISLYLANSKATSKWENLWKILFWFFCLATIAAFSTFITAFLVQSDFLRSNRNTAIAGTTTAILAMGTAAYGFWSKYKPAIERSSRSLGEIVKFSFAELAATTTIAAILIACSLTVTYITIGIGSLVNSRPGLEYEPTACRIALPAMIDLMLEKHESREIACKRFKKECDGRADEYAGKDGFWLEAFCGDAKDSGDLNFLDLSKIGVPVPVSLNIADAHVKAINNAKATNITLIFMTSIAIIFTVLSGGVFSFSFSNHSSFSFFYKERLRKAFLRFNPEKLHESASEPKKRRRTISHVANCTVNIYQSKHEETLPGRQSDSFSFAEDFYGSKATGYLKKSAQCRHQENLTPADIMAMSGAAASPAMGQASSSILAAVIAFFNIRIGFWIRNPKNYSASDSLLPGSLQQMTTPWRELLSMTDATSDVVYITDGGHFENLGLYEMIRRKCKHIILVDAGKDQQYRYEDLRNAVRKARIDLHAEIEFEEEALVMPQASSKLGQNHYCVGKIIYHGESTLGSIILIKPVLCGALPLDVLGYADLTHNHSSPFPQQSTVDQFFDEAQFESYRMLGYHSGLKALSAYKHWPENSPEYEENKSWAEADQNRRGYKAWQKSDFNDTCTCPAHTGLGINPVDSSEPCHDDPVQPANSQAGARIAGSLGNIGSTALMAATVAITAAVTVSGTIALTNGTITVQPDTITLKQSSSDEEDSSQSGPAKPQPPYTASQPVVVEPGPELIKQIDRLLAALAECKQSAERTGATQTANGPSPVDMEKCRKTLDITNNFYEAAKQLESPESGDSIDIAGLMAALDKIAVSINAAGIRQSQKDQELAKILKGINENLQATRELLNKIHIEAKEAKSNSLGAKENTDGLKRKAPNNFIGGGN